MLLFSKCSTVTFSLPLACFSLCFRPLCALDCSVLSCVAVQDLRKEISHFPSGGDAASCPLGEGMMIYNRYMEMSNIPEVLGLTLSL